MFFAPDRRNYFWREDANNLMMRSNSNDTVVVTDQYDVLFTEDDLLNVVENVVITMTSSDDVSNPTRIFSYKNKSRKGKTYHASSIREIAMIILWKFGHSYKDKVRIFIKYIFIHF
jgi:hypothetical protein